MAIREGPGPNDVTRFVLGIGNGAGRPKRGCRCISGRGGFLCRRDGNPFVVGCRFGLGNSDSSVNETTGDMRLFLGLGSILKPEKVPYSLIILSVFISDSQLALGEEYRGDIGAIVASGNGILSLIEHILLLAVTIDEKISGGTEDAPVIELIIEVDADWLPDLKDASYSFFSFSISPGFCRRIKGIDRVGSFGMEVGSIPGVLCPLINLRT